MPIEVKEHVVETDEGQRHVIIAQPTFPLVITRTRLLTLRTNLKESTVDLALQKAVCAREHTIHAFALRTESQEGERLWRFAGDLTPEEGVELGYLLMVSQINTYRVFASEGLHGILVTGLGKREFNALNLGRERVIERFEKELEFDGLRSEEAKTRELGIWLLRNFVHFLPFVTVDDSLESFLPRCLSVLPGKLGVPEHLKSALGSQWRVSIR